LIMLKHDIRAIFGRWKTCSNVNKRMPSYTLYPEEIKPSVEWEGQYKYFSQQLSSRFKAAYERVSV